MDSETSQDACDWKNKYYEQWKYNNTVITQFKLLKINEKKLIAKLREWERYNECIHSELNNCKIKVEEKNNTIDKLRTDLVLKEEELCNVRKKLECVCNQLRFEFECQEMELIKPKSQCNQLVRKNINFEQDALPSKFKKVCDKLRETKIAFEEAKSIIKNDILSIKNSAVAIATSTEREENDHYTFFVHQVQKLKEINHMKNEELRCMNKRIQELERQNECNVLKINKQRKKIQESKSIIENVQLLKSEYGHSNHQRNNYISLRKKLDNLFQSLPDKCCNLTY